MTATTHNIAAEHTVLFRIPGMPDDERESANVKLEIAYTYLLRDPGCRTQRNGDPGWPPEPAEVDLVAAKLIDGDGLAPTQDQINEWAIDWLDDAGYDAACENAEDDRENDRYNAREQAGRDRFRDLCGND
jgi:hypothetical protein